VLSSGHLLDNRYRLDERIATGGMGDVWRGTDVVLGRTVAVKVLRPAMMADPEFAARFYGEARMMAAFRHPGVVEVYDYASAGDSQDDDCAYLVMAYVEGEPLSTLLKEAGRLSVGETMSIVAQTADALHAAHQNGTIHRDVKPGNLIVRPNGAVVLVDFGVARSNAVTSMTGVNSIVGTALYMAPEQVTKGRVTPATDIYALGAVAYHCLAGRPPFDGDNALQVALRHLEDEPDPLPDDVPPAVRALVSRAMAKNPADRFDSAADLAQAALAASKPIDWTAMASAPATATAAAAGAPLSPAPAYATAPTRTVPAPATLPPTPPPDRRRIPRSQLIVLLTIIGLMILAAGLAIAIAMSGNGDRDPGLGGTPVQQPSPGTSGSARPGGQPVPAQSGTTRRATQPNAGTVRPQTTSPRTSATPSTAATTGPTATPTTTRPVTEPTTTPTATAPASAGAESGPR
jgi:serine/threonine protein kinase